MICRRLVAVAVGVALGLPTVARVQAAAPGSDKASSESAEPRIETSEPIASDGELKPERSDAKGPESESTEPERSDAELEGPDSESAEPELESSEAGAFNGESEGSEPRLEPTEQDVVSPEVADPGVDAPVGSSEIAPASADDLGMASGVAPGGYHGHGVILERPPVDGQRNLVVGSILFPLGTIATITSGVGAWATVPAHCVRRLASIGIEISSPDRCQGLFAFNVVRTSYGALMLVTGAVIMALGLRQRAIYRKWRHDHGMRATLLPTPGRRGATLGASWRF